ncbi:MAG: ATP-binding protein [Leptospira sp.]|nr:ATP-binding protein [Leptospira sp.]
MEDLNFDNLHTIVDKSGIGIIILNNDEKIILSNQWFYRYSGFDFSSLKDKLFLDVFPEFKNSRTHTSIKLCLEDQQYSILTHTLNPFPFPLYENSRDRLEDKRIYQYLHIIPIQITTSEGCLCMIQISDVSQQVTRENMLREQMNIATSIKEEAIRASNAKSVFLASMSHEIRTPLNAILGMTEILEETNLDVDQRKYLDVLRNSGKALFNLINDILDFSRIEAGKLEIDNHPYSLLSVIEETLSLFYLRAKNKGVVLESFIFPGLSTSVYGDPIRIQQILINLLGNSIKFTQKGKILLRITHIFDEDTRREMMVIEVSDTGIGIPPDKIDKIFDSFTQGDSSTTRKYGGTGLGLAITKKLVNLLNGKINVKSEFGIGSTFTIQLPYLPYLETELQLQTTFDGIDVPEPSKFPKLKLLLAEDSPENIFLVQTILRKYPIEIDVAENGKIAVDKAMSNKYNVALMDMQMPIMDGNEAIKLIRDNEKKSKIPTSKSLPIIALTANVSKEDIKKSFEAGCSSYLTKPVRKTDLVRLIYFYTTSENALILDKHN